MCLINTYAFLTHLCARAHTHTYIYIYIRIHIYHTLYSYYDLCVLTPLCYLPLVHPWHRSVSYSATVDPHIPLQTSANTPETNIKSGINHFHYENGTNSGSKKLVTKEGNGLASISHILRNGAEKLKTSDTVAHISTCTSTFMDKRTLQENKSDSSDRRSHKKSRIEKI